MMKSTFIKVLNVVAVFLVGIVSLSQVSATAVLNPNQLSGTISFSNTNPEILNILSPDGGGAGFNYMYIRADSLDIVPALNNYSFPPADGWNSSTYELTVESSDAGIRYRMNAEVRLDNRGDRYMFNTVESSGVYPEPNADTKQDISECAAMLDVKFVDLNNDPVNISGGSITAYREYTAGSGYYITQAQDYALPNGINHEYLAVRGDGTEYKVDTILEGGSDPYSNKVRTLCRRYVTASCDQIVPIVCPIGGTMLLGAIKGEVDILNETEIASSYLTRMWAHDGALKNYRYDKVEGSGFYLLENLVPSAVESPPKDYMLRSYIGIRSGYRYEYFSAPVMDGYWNPRVPVVANETTDMGQTFVIDPGYVNGTITLSGPPQGDYLQDLYRDAERDYNKDGIPDIVSLPSSKVYAYGVTTKADGATYSAAGGNAGVGFVGDYDAATALFTGDYEMVLGGLNKEPSIWRPNNMFLMFSDRLTPEEPATYQYSNMLIMNRTVNNVTITPGSMTELNHDYCMSEVRLEYRSLAGTFYNPQARARATFQGLDYKGNMANYFVNLMYAFGTPRSMATASSRGLVAMILPQGDYSITPLVTAVNPNGTTSYTELPPVDIGVGCRQVITLTTQLQLNMEDIPALVEDGVVTITGQFNSGSNVVRISYNNNGGEDVIICSDCGINPNFTAEVTLELGENIIVVTGVDEMGGEATVTSVVDNDPPVVEPPVVEEPPVVYDPVIVTGCADVNVKIPHNESVSLVDFDIKASGGCSVPVVSCDPASGSQFAAGGTNVTCNAEDSCGVKAECGFTVNVIKEDPPQEEKDDSDTACNKQSDKPLFIQSIANNMLWPPNHKFADIGLKNTINDPCAEDGKPSFSLSTEVWSDETEIAEKGDGSGNFAPDAKGLDDVRLLLRAERRGNGDGRVYLIITRAIDASGVRKVMCNAVMVPKSFAKKHIEQAQKQATEAVAYCEANNGAAPESFYKHGIADEIDKKGKGYGNNKLPNSKAKGKEKVKGKAAVPAKNAKSVKASVFSKAKASNKPVNNYIILPSSLLLTTYVEAKAKATKADHKLEQLARKKARAESRRNARMAAEDFRSEHSSEVVEQTNDVQSSDKEEVADKKEQENEEPVSLSCNNASARIPAYESWTAVDFNVRAGGGCSTPSVSCSSTSGSLFAVGKTDISCVAIDSCGSQASCSFTVNVKQKAAKISAKD